MATLIYDPRFGFFRSQLKSHTLDDLVAALHKDLTITTRGDGSHGRFIDISFTYFDRIKSQQTVNAVMNRITEDNRAITRSTGPVAVRETNWGNIVPGYEASISVDAVSPSRRSTMIPGLLSGLTLAAIIAMVRRRWVAAEEDEADAPRKSGGPLFNRTRFRRFAGWLMIAGALCGAVAATIAPTRYVSDALVAFDNVSADRMAILINNAAGGRHDLSWQQVELGGAKTDAFRIQFVADNPARARTVVQDVLGDIDRGITKLRGGDDNPFEEIRGVDGALLPLGSPVAISATEPPDKIAIAFDDDRAKAAPQPQFRAIRMNVIDPPVLPSHSEGMGWWSVAIGMAAGLALAFLLSLIRGMDGWQKKEWGHRQVTPLR